MRHRTPPPCLLYSPHKTVPNAILSCAVATALGLALGTAPAAAEKQRHSLGPCPVRLSHGGQA